MPFDTQAVRSLLTVTGLDYRSLSRDILDVTEVRVSRLALQNWIEAKSPRPPTAKQLDTLYLYSAKKGFNLRFYSPPGEDNQNP